MINPYLFAFRKLFQIIKEDISLFSCCSLIRTYLIHSRKQSTDGVRKKRNHTAGYLPAD